MKTKFTIFLNQFIGTTRKAEDFAGLINNVMTRKEKKHWSNIQFKNKENQTVNITREFLEYGMTFEEVVNDWIENASEEMLCEEILSIN